MTMMQSIRVQLKPAMTSMMTAMGESMMKMIRWTPYTGSVWYADDDGDGYGDDETSVESCDAPEEYVSNNTDCDDRDDDISPDATEVCDSEDNDCDGDIDDADSELRPHHWAGVVSGLRFGWLR